jgi:hypothetical protein
MGCTGFGSSGKRELYGKFWNQFFYLTLGFITGYYRCEYRDWVNACGCRVCAYSDCVLGEEVEAAY